MDNSHNNLIGNTHNGNGSSGSREIECRVCGDKASGKHYGVPSCDGCRGFFKRSIRRNLDYICKESGTCIVDVTRRNQCQSCRFKKCLQVNMKRDAVQHERAPRINGLHKTLRSTGNPFHSAFSASNPSSLFFHGLNNGHPPGSLASMHNHHHHHHHLLKHFCPTTANNATTSSSGGSSISTPAGSLSIIQPQLQFAPTSAPPIGFYPFHLHSSGPAGGGGFPLFPMSSTAAARIMFGTLPPPPSLTLHTSSTTSAAATANNNNNSYVSEEEDEDLPSTKSASGASSTTTTTTHTTNVVSSRDKQQPSVNSNSNNTSSKMIITREEEEVSTTTNHDQLDFNNTGSSGIVTSMNNNYPTLIGSTASIINENVYESAAKLLFLSIKWARSVPSFCALPPSDQCTLLAYSWSELFVLSAAQCGLVLDDSFFHGKSTQHLLNAKRLSDLLSRITSLSPDHTELACMKAVVLFKPETPNLTSQIRMELLQDQTMIMLQEYCFAKSPLNKLRFGKLLLIFPHLKTISSYDLEELFFKQTVGEVSIQKLITDLVKSTF